MPTEPQTPIAMSTKLPLEYTLPELGAGKTVELIRVTSDKGGRLEEVVRKTTTDTGGYFVLKGNILWLIVDSGELG